MNSSGAVRKMPWLSNEVNILLTAWASCVLPRLSCLFFKFCAIIGTAFTEFRNSNCPIFCLLPM